MSVVVLNMQMPKSCESCGVTCELWVMHKLGQRHPDCPLRPLPEKHGRLIDMDKLEGAGYALSKLHIDSDSQNPKQMIWRELIPFDEVPTIIEAEGGSTWNEKENP